VFVELDALVIANGVTPLAHCHHRGDLSAARTGGGVGRRSRRLLWKRSSCLAQAGHPVRRGFSINHERLGILDHPPSRVTTVVGTEAVLCIRT
jgi:hypothetical protein